MTPFKTLHLVYRSTPSASLLKTKYWLWEINFLNSTCLTGVFLHSPRVSPTLETCLWSFRLLVIKWGSQGKLMKPKERNLWPQGLEIGDVVSSGEDEFKSYFTELWILFFPRAASRHGRLKLPPMFSRRFGAIRTWEMPWPRMAGIKRTSRFFLVPSAKHFLNIISDTFNTFFHPYDYFQPIASGTPKGSKSCKPGYDDTTLPLMEKNQG